MAGHNANDRQIAFHRYQGDLRRLREAMAMVRDDEEIDLESDLVALLVKRFEVAFESARRAMRSQVGGGPGGGVSAAVQMVVGRGILASEERWTSMLATRNATVHDYSKETVRKALAKIAAEHMETLAALHDFLQGEQS